MDETSYDRAHLVLLRESFRARACLRCCRAETAPLRRHCRLCQPPIRLTSHHQRLAAADGGDTVTGSLRYAESTSELALHSVFGLDALLRRWYCRPHFPQVAATYLRGVCRGNQIWPFEDRMDCRRPASLQEQIRRTNVPFCCQTIRQISTLSGRMALGPWTSSFRIETCGPLTHHSQENPLKQGRQRFNDGRILLRRNKAVKSAKGLIAATESGGKFSRKYGSGVPLLVLCSATRTTPSSQDLISSGALFVKFVHYCCNLTAQVELRVCGRLFSLARCA